VSPSKPQSPAFSVIRAKAMDGDQRQGRPAEELFMPPSVVQPQTPSVWPLRVNKASLPAGNRVDVFSGPYNPNGDQATTSRPVNVLPYPDSPPYRPIAVSNPAHIAAIFNSNPTPSGTSQNTPEFGWQNSSYSTPQEDARNRTTGTRYNSSSTSEEGFKDSLRNAEAFASTPKPLPASPGPETPDKDSTFSRSQQRKRESPPQSLRAGPPPMSQLQTYQYGGTQEQRYPSAPMIHSRPNVASAANLDLPDAQGVNRLASTSSVSTTKAARGSPPPPETPIDVSDELPRFPASGSGSPSIPNGIQAQRIGGEQEHQMRLAQFHHQQERQRQAQSTPTSRPLHQRLSAEEAVSPLSDHDTDPFLTQEGVQVPRVYGQGEPSADGVAYSPQPHQSSRERPVEQDLRRLHIGEEAPPAYVSVLRPGQTQPSEKASPRVNERLRLNSMSPASDHPAFENDIQRMASDESNIASPTPSSQHHNAYAAVAPQKPITPPATVRATPPPLPEGWISHLDPSSGHYYYIHLPTQSTQWEFPKGPTPLNINDPPLSPTGTLVNHPLASPSVSSFGGKPLASPGFPSQKSHYAGSVYSMGISSPTAAGFTGPPPSSGVETYRVAPANGVYFGPYLRYTNMDVDNGIWHGSIMLVTDTPHPPTIHLHRSNDLSPNRKSVLFRFGYHFLTSFSSAAEGEVYLATPTMGILQI